MDVTANLDAPCSSSTLFAWIDDLAHFPAWLDIVARSVPVARDPVDPGPAWQVDLRGRLGPLARSKRLRMVRAEHLDQCSVRFERRELDGRHHAPWVLDAAVESVESGSRLTMHLHYGGTLFGPVLERVLVDEIERSRPRLLTLVADGPPFR